MLDVRDVHAGYGQVDVLHGITLSVRRGAVVAVIGPNGAGKTTLGKAIAGLSRPSAGRVLLDGRDVTAIPVVRAREQGISYALEGRRLFGSMSVEENLLAGGLQLRRRSAIREATWRIYDLFPVLREKRRAAAASLSGGEAQMLALGRALMVPPKVVILDEPTLGLAPMMVARVWQVIRDVAATGVAVLLMEQNAKLAQAASGYVHVLRNGRAVLAGHSGELTTEAIHGAYLGVGGRQTTVRDASS